MAAILCRYCCVEPCTALAKCCERCGKCSGSCCAALTKCCDRLTSPCEKPFSCCLLISVSVTLVALTVGVLSILSGGSQCDKPLFALGITLLVCTAINTIFSCYVYRTINYDEDNRLFEEQRATTTSAKLYVFFKQDKWMAVYLIFVLLLIALLCTCMAMARSCHSSIGKGVFWVSVMIFIYIAISTFILLRYVAVNALREWAKTGWCWAIPVCWPCLFVGWCLNLGQDDDDSGSIRYQQAPNLDY